MRISLFLFGAGYSGRAIAQLVIADGGKVWGTTRSPDKAAALAAEGIGPLLFDGPTVSSDIVAALRDATHIVVSVAPEHGMGAAGGGPGEKTIDPVLAAVGDIIGAGTPELRWIGYLSTVGVYGGHDGAWVGEDAECRPGSKRSAMRLDADNAWLALSERSGIPVAVLRLSGIYGPGRNALVNLENGTARRIIKQGQVFNRIHVDDIAGAALHLAEKGLGGVYNVSDDEPSPPQDVIEFAAGLMGVEPPPEIAFDDADLTPMARSFYGENKRVSNAKLKAYGYRFVHPDYRSALEAMWKAGGWRGRSS